MKQEITEISAEEEPGQICYATFGSNKGSEEIDVECVNSYIKKDRLEYGFDGGWGDMDGLFFEVKGGRDGDALFIPLNRLDEFNVKLEVKR